MKSPLGEGGLAIIASGMKTYVFGITPGSNFQTITNRDKFAYYIVGQALRPTYTLYLLTPYPTYLPTTIKGAQ